MNEPSRRVDKETRERIDDIFELVDEIQKRFHIFSSRVIRFVSLIFIMSGLSIAGFGYAIHRVQESRLEASEQSCISKNNQNVGIRTVLTKFSIDDPYILDLFPIEPDCKHYAKKAIK